MKRCEHGIDIEFYDCKTCAEKPGGLRETDAVGNPIRPLAAPRPQPQVTPLTDSKQSVLVEAENLINGDRAASYGPPEVNFLRWRDMCRSTGRANLAQITSEDLAVVMICLKIARDTNSAKRDNLVDGAAYFELWNRVRNF